MKLPRISHLTSILLVAAIIMLNSPAAVDAHSTKGRIKIPLAKGTLTIDDVAYFMESYVHHELYRDRSGKNVRRLYVKEFIKVEQNENQAVVHFVVLDVKSHGNFPDRMTIKRMDNGIWYYQPDNGQPPVEIYTFVLKWEYYYQKYLLPISAAGIVLAVILFIGARIVKRKTFSVTTVL